MRPIETVTGLPPAGHARAGKSSRTLAPQHDLDRLHEDREVEQQAAVLDVVQVVLELLDRVFLGRPVRVAELRPTGDARLHGVALAVVRDLLLELADELGPLGPWPDEAHLPAQDV